MKAFDVFAGSDGALTRAYYARLLERGNPGIVAMNLFCAQKCSTRAKKYHGGLPGKGSYSKMAYERKNFSLQELCKALFEHGPEVGITFGWKKDPSQDFASWVLYVDLPNGQVSFHCTVRYEGPDYPGDWDEQRASEIRILAFCDSVFQQSEIVAVKDAVRTRKDAQRNRGDSESRQAENAQMPLLFVG
jgi:hypothetical protein